jgi:hypothetical protein
VDIPEAQNQDGLWNSCSYSEAIASKTFDAILEPFENAFKNCYESGVEATTFKCTRSNDEDMKIAASFLKRSLTDFRTVWLLITLGYTSQAASIAAALYEHSLVVVVLAGNPENEKRIKKSASGDAPWKPKELAKMAVKLERKENENRGQKKGNAHYEHRTKEIYYFYKYLCKTKHPTLPSVWHHSLGTKTDTESFVVRAFPDFRHEDLAFKCFVLLGSINCMHRAIRRFVINLGVKVSREEFIIFSKKLNSATDESIEAFKILGGGPLPYGLDDFN